MSSARRDEAPHAAGRAWREFCERLGAAGEALFAQLRADDPRSRAEGLRWLTRLLVHATQFEVEARDAEHPVFYRYEDPWTQWGAPNPDNVYLRAAVDPAHEYRVWAKADGLREAIFSLHQGDMQLGELGVYSERMLGDLELSENGDLELWLSAREREGNWIPMHEDARLFQVRLYLSDWELDAAPPFHIERVGGEGVAPPPPEEEAVASALARAAEWVERSAEYWPEYIARAGEHLPKNRPTPARAAAGGAEHILYGACYFQLGADELLLIECEVPEAEYWNFAMHTPDWFESGDFANRTTSLSDRQAHVDTDGRVRIAVAAADPGVPNWIDTEGRGRGLLTYRWVAARNNPVPTGEVVKRDDLRAALPADHPRVSSDERRKAISRRREALWARYR